jgi:mannose-6-phosphate isomerase-like protein (cupin superfamily)
VGYTIFQSVELEFVPRGDDDPRSIAGLSDALSRSRANIWRYPPGSKGRRHADPIQEEVFVVLDGTLTIDLGDPPERHEVPRGGLVVVESGTPLQLRNTGDEELPRRPDVCSGAGLPLRAARRLGGGTLLRPTPRRTTRARRRRSDA